MKDDYQEDSYKGDKMIVKTNRLVTAIQRLTLNETRIMLLAIAEARENGFIDENYTVEVSAQSFVDTFDIIPTNAYKALIEAEEKLFERRFQFINDRGNNVKSRWISAVEYHNDEGFLTLSLSPKVIDEVLNIKGIEQVFTGYTIRQISSFKSVYSIRLYELLKNWATVGKTQIFELNALREQLGIEEDEYTHLSNLKKRVIDVGVKEINEKSDLTISYTQVKKRQKVVGLVFNVNRKKEKFNRKKISVEEAIKISQEIPGGFVNETEKQAIKRVMEYKDENGRSVYLVNTKDKDWKDHRAVKKQLSDKIEKKGEERKWRTIGNTLVNDKYIDEHKEKGETHLQAKARIEKELEAQLQLDLQQTLEDDRPLWEVLQDKKRDQ